MQYVEYSTKELTQTIAEILEPEDPGNSNKAIAIIEDGKIEGNLQENLIDIHHHYTTEELILQTIKKIRRTNYVFALDESSSIRE
jgi:hypothetical protein